MVDVEANPGAKQGVVRLYIWKVLELPFIGNPDPQANLGPDELGPEPNSCNTK